MSTPTLRQHKGGGGAVSLSSTPTDGSLILIQAVTRDGIGFPATPSGFSVVESETSTLADDPGSGTAGYARLYSKVAAGESGTYAIANALLQVTEWAAGTTVASTAIATAANGTVALTITPGAANTVVLGFAAVGVFFGPTITPDGGLTVLDDLAPVAPDAPHNWGAYKAVAAPASTTIGATFTEAVGHYAWAGIVAVLAGPVSPPSPGVWHDFDGDGFTDAGAVGSEDGRLTMEFPEGGTTAVSDNITTDVMSIDIDQGGTAEVTGGAGTDTATIVVQNATGKYTPDNAASPVYGKVRPGKRVWIGVNADGTLTGTGQTIYGIFAGLVREVAPIPAGAALAPTAEIICDGILQSYGTPVTVADSTERSQYTFRVAVLDAVGESATRRDLAVEADTLPLSSADSTSALSVLEELNGANGTRHYIAADADKDTWYKYTTRNRHYKNGVAADASINAGVEHLSEVSGWRYNDDSIENHARASVDPISFPFAIAQVWTYDNVPFTLTGNQTIWANFDDYVRSPVVTVTSSGSVTSSITSFGHSAKLVLFGTGVTVTNIKITGQQVERAQGISLVADDLASQASFGVHSASEITTPLVGAAASAQGIVDHIVWRYGSRPLKRPSITAHNWLPYLLSLRLYDQIGVTLAAVSASAIKFEIIGRQLHCDVAASASLVDWIGSFTVAESRIQGTQTWFTLDVSTLDGPDLLAY